MPGDGEPVQWKGGARSIWKTGWTLTPIGVIIGWTLRHALITRERSNDRASLAIIEQAGETLEILRALPLSDEDIETSL